MRIRGNSILIRGLGRGYHAKRFGKYAQTKHGHLQKDCRTNKCSDEGKQRMPNEHVLSRSRIDLVVLI
jgi:hypothetical protein